MQLVKLRLALNAKINYSTGLLRSDRWRLDKTKEWVSVSGFPRPFLTAEEAAGDPIGETKVNVLVVVVITVFNTADSLQQFKLIFENKLWHF